MTTEDIKLVIGAIYEKAIEIVKEAKPIGYFCDSHKDEIPKSHDRLHCVCEQCQTYRESRAPQGSVSVISQKDAALADKIVNMIHAKDESLTLKERIAIILSESRAAQGSEDNTGNPQEYGDS